MITHVAVPVLSVTALHVSAPLRVNVTVSPEIGVSVAESIRTAETGVGDEKLPETGLIVRAVGVAEATVDDVAALSSPLTDRPKRKAVCALIVCIT